MFVRMIPVFLLFASLGNAAGAENAIKFGNWEYSATASGVTQLPPGVQPSPDLRLGPEGLTFSRTRCITSAEPPLPPIKAGEPCKMDKTDVNGGTLSWSVTCATPEITIHQEWIAHYHGETMDGQVTTRSTTSDHPSVETTQQIKGRYLGPCPAE